MRIAAALIPFAGLAYSCNRDDDLVPLGILALVALGVFAVLAMQLSDERADEGTRTPTAPWLTTCGRFRSAAPANDNANPESRAS